jgi:HD-like signal output (HDOD) protein/prolyl-tRNA editing enzyme YbaK/EbsC (Cys-tRNA(Pro) deacylase)
MAIPATIKRFLDAHLATYEVLEHPPAATADEAAADAYVAPAQLLQTAVLSDRRGLLVAAYPLDRELDLTALNRELRRDLTVLSPTERQGLFPDCDAALVPALSAAYGIKAVLDEGLQSDATVYFRASGSELLCMRLGDLQRIQHAWRSRVTARQDGEGEALAPQPANPPAAQLQRRFQDRIEAVKELPPMPEMGQRVMQLRANPYAGVEDLARIVELDPSLAAQVIHYARSPFFGYRGEVVSVADAISRVLGYDMTMNIVLGIAVGRPFRVPREGPLGLAAFWRGAVYCAAVTQVLGRSLLPHLRPAPGLAYLSGLLHNFGLLLLGDLFAPEFYWLDKAVARHPDRDLAELETEILGVSHTQLAVWLMKQWNLPPEVVAAAREHHNPDYDQLHAVYPRLVLIANRLLRRAGIGEAACADLPPGVLQALSLSQHQAEQVLATVLEAGDGLDQLARQLAA